MSMIQDDSPALRSRRKQGGSRPASDLSDLSPQSFSDRSRKNRDRPSIKTSNLEYQRRPVEGFAPRHTPKFSENQVNHIEAMAEVLQGKNIEIEDAVQDLIDLIQTMRVSLGDINSIINKYKVDCVVEKQTWMNDTYYSQSMGKE